MKKLVLTTVCLCVPYCAHGAIPCDKTSFDAAKEDLIARCNEMEFCQGSQQEKPLAHFIHGNIKELMFAMKNGILSDEEQNYYLCSYNILCSLLNHEPADSIDGIDKAWIEEIDYRYWKLMREGVVRRSDDLNRSIEQSVITSFQFYTAKLRNDPHGIWDDYAMKLRHAYRFLKEHHLIDDSMTLENSDDWIYDLDDRIS